jgi:hypothetical protein
MPVGRLFSRCVRVAFGLGAVVAALSLGASRGDSSRAGGDPTVRLSLHRAGNTVAVKAFSLSGSADGLYPGGKVPLALTIVNPNKQDLMVKTINVVAGDAGACSAAQLVADSFAGSLLVRKQSRVTVSLDLQMSDEAGNECKGASFPLTYRGTAEAG